MIEKDKLLKWELSELLMQELFSRIPREELRNFNLPSKINFEAHDYVDVIS